MTTETTRLLSPAGLSQSLQRPVSRIFAAAQALRIHPAVTIDSVEYYSYLQAARIAARLQQEERKRP
jgi:hypothetical protein